MQLFRTLLLAASLFLASAQEQEGYLGFNSGATFDDGTEKQQEDFEAEFKAAQELQNSPGLINSVRLYTNIQGETTATPFSAFKAAIATNTTMLLGIWCSGTTSISNELSALKKALSDDGQEFADLVVGISVGSEDLYRASKDGIKNEAGIGTGPDEIVEFIDEVRSFVNGTLLSDKPIGHVDSWTAWANGSNSAVVEAVDFVGVDIYPYYEDKDSNPISNASTIFDDRYNRTLEGVGDKPIWITETGWPSSGPNWADAVPSVDNAMEYWKTVGCKLFGRTNVWWYNLRDSNPENDEKFAITEDLSTEPRFDLTCPTGSGAPAPINTDSAAAGMIGKSSILMSVVVAAVVSFLCVSI